MAAVIAFPELQTIRRQSVSEAVYEQLRDQIVAGRLPAGSALPAERKLCEAFGVNRSAVREALKRLEQARLVCVRHGGSSRVCDFRAEAGLDLLPELLLGGEHVIAPDVVRSVMEMRSAIAPDVARLAVERSRGGDLSRMLADIVRAMRDAGEDLERLQQLSTDFWSLLVDASGNIAYRLAYNSLRQVYDRTRALLVPVLASEIADVDAYAAIAADIARGDAEAVVARASELVRRGEAGIKAALERMTEDSGGES